MAYARPPAWLPQECLHGIRLEHPNDTMYVAHVKAKSDDYVGLEEDRRAVQAVLGSSLDGEVPKYDGPEIRARRERIARAKTGVSR